MLYPFGSCADLNGEQFIIAVKSTAFGCATAAPPLVPRCEKLLNAVGDWPTLHETQNQNRTHLQVRTGMTSLDEIRVITGWEYTMENKQNEYRKCSVNIVGGHLRM